MENLFWIGHASFYIKNKAGLNIFIDPFNISEETAKNKADVILITHAHFDHCSKKDIEKIATQDTEIIAAPGCLSELDYKKLKIIQPNESLSVKGIEIETVPAYNIKKERVQFHPKSNNWVGYIIDVDGTKIYHAGDTDFIDEMNGLKSKNIEFALLPMGGTYTMDEEEAVEAAKAINAKFIVPMHYKNLLGKVGSERIEKELKNKKRVNALILKEVQEPTYSFNNR